MGCSSVAVYTELSSKPSGWNTKWNLGKNNVTVATAYWGEKMPVN